MPRRLAQRDCPLCLWPPTASHNLVAWPILACQADSDAQEKAVLALQKLLAAGVLAGDGSSGGCAVDVIGRELETLRQRCGAGADAETEGAEGMTAEGCAAVSALQLELRR